MRAARLAVGLDAAVADSAPDRAPGAPVIAPGKPATTPAHPPTTPGNPPPAATRPPDQAIARLATSQHGLVTSPQLAALGLTHRAIGCRIGGGRLHQVHRGVYLVGHRAPPPSGRLHAAVLAVGVGALLSHRAAAVIWGLLDPAPGPVDVTVVGRRPRERDGIRLHRVGRIDRADTAERDGIPVTAAARTVLDLAATGPADLVERAAAEARVHGLATTEALAAAMERAPGHRGTAALQRLLAAGAEPRLTRSVAERKLLALMRSARLEPTATNVPVAGYEADLLWRAERLIVEVDSYQFHGTREAFERDRQRDAAHVAAGYRVLRITWRQLVNEPAAVVATIARALAQSG